MEFTNKLINYIKKLFIRDKIILQSDEPIETLVSKYSSYIIFLMENKRFEYDRFKKTALRINECITRLNTLAMNYEKTGNIDDTIKKAIESWANKESTPKEYKGVFK
jgi:hypothetical protein